MFYVITDNGINITEVGRAPLFIGKDHENFKRIKENIRNLTYNQIQQMTDIKSKIVGYINENAETYFNDDDDLEMKIDLNEDITKGLKILARDQIMGNKDEDELNEKESYLIKLIEGGSLNIVGIKLIFEQEKYENIYQRANNNRS